MIKTHIPRAALPRGGFVLVGIFHCQIILLTERLHIRRRGAPAGADDRQRMLGGGGDGADVQVQHRIGDDESGDIAAFCHRPHVEIDRAIPDDDGAVGAWIILWDADKMVAPIENSVLVLKQGIPLGYGDPLQLGKTGGGEGVICQQLGSESQILPLLKRITVWLGIALEGIPDQCIQCRWQGNLTDIFDRPVCHAEIDCLNSFVKGQFSDVCGIDVVCYDIGDSPDSLQVGRNDKFLCDGKGNHFIECPKPTVISLIGTKAKDAVLRFDLMQNTVSSRFGRCCEKNVGLGR